MDTKEQRFTFDFFGSDQLGKRDQAAETWDTFSTARLNQDPVLEQPSKFQFTAAKSTQNTAESWDNFELEVDELQKMLKK